jgi:hypothetical protein
MLFRFCLSLCFLFVSQGWINFFSLPDGLRHLFGDHNPSSILICCVIYDLEGNNDAFLIKTTAATSRDHPLQTMSVPQSAYPHVRMPGARALVNQRVAIATLVTDPYKGSESSS